MKRPITVYLSFTAILTGTLICAPGSQAQTQEPLAKNQVETGSTETEAQAYHELSKAEQGCIV